ncbi:unnamed protein product, partial [Urochloa humidicola]
RTKKTSSEATRRNKQSAHGSSGQRQVDARSHARLPARPRARAAGAEQLRQEGTILSALRSPYVLPASASTPRVAAGSVRSSKSSSLAAPLLTPQRGPWHEAEVGARIDSERNMPQCDRGRGMLQRGIDVREPAGNRAGEAGIDGDLELGRGRALPVVRGGAPPPRRATLELEVAGVKQTSATGFLCAPSSAKVWWLGVGARGHATSSRAGCSLCR